MLNKHFKIQECRKNLLRENKPINDIFRKTALNGFEQVIERIKDNKKKLIFFVIVLIACQYTGGYEKIVFWWKYREPFKNKIMRWFFGVQNVIPSTIVEQRFDDIKISPESLDILSIQFREKEKSLKLGLTRKYLFKVYEDLEIFEKEDDKRFFYSASGYGKLRNQKPAGINLKEFLKIFQQGYEKKHKKDPRLSESEYLKQFLISIESHHEKMKDWESRFMTKRNDFLKINMEIEKKQVVKEILQSKPLISMEDLEKELQKIGLYGLSVKEKILTLNNQLVLLELFKNYYDEKRELSFGGEKAQKQKLKAEKIDQQIETVKKQLDEQNAIFSGYFKNILLFKDYESK